MNQEKQRPRFRASGPATIKHLNVRKEGPEDEKIIAVDVKMEVRGLDYRLCDYFDDALAQFLWRGDTEAMIVRNAYLDPVKYIHTITSASAEIGSLNFIGCEVDKFAIQPRDGGVINLVCSVTAYPNADEVALLAKYVQEDCRVDIEGPPDLFSTPAPAPKGERERVLLDIKAKAEQTPESLVSLAMALVTAPDGRASISYLQRNLKIGYNAAARVMEILEKNGIVSAMAPNGTRKILSVA